VGWGHDSILTFSRNLSCFVEPDFIIIIVVAKSSHSFKNDFINLFQKRAIYVGRSIADDSVSKICMSRCQGKCCRSSLKTVLNIFFLLFLRHFHIMWVIRLTLGASGFLCVKISLITFMMKLWMY
jgi:hypothetical protein